MIIKVQEARSFLSKVEGLYIEQGRSSRELEDFIIRRKFTEKMATQFGIGFAPVSNLISEYVKDNAHLQDLALELGLISQGSAGLRDHFRNRIMFPVRDEFGYTLGFYSRSHGPGLPRYLISHESFHFNPDELIFGLDLARDSIKKEGFAIIVEGIMDVIDQHDKGIKNVISFLGRGPSATRTQKIRNLTSRAVLALDADAAGMRATERFLVEFPKHGILAVSS